MLSSLLNRLWNGGLSTLEKLRGHYTLTQGRLQDHISMKPKDILDRSVMAGNWTTCLAIAICYPLLLYFRGLDWQLLGGMVLMYASFWVAIFLLVLSIQILWLINYAISQRFVENYLDFEIVERILGHDRTQYEDEDDYDSDEEMIDLGDLEVDGDEVFDANGRLRATG